MTKDRFNQIPRVKALSRQIFEQEFLLQSKPVIFTDLFEGQAVRDISDVKVVRYRLGDMPITISEGFRPYLFTDLDPSSQPSRHCSINQYLDLITQEPETFLLCSENQVHDSIQELFEIPNYCQFGNLAEDLTTRLFLGNAGNYAHLHFDGDFRHVLFHQVFGTKRIVIFPADAAPKLSPNKQWSMICLEHFTEAEKNSFIDYAGGVQCILNPGETLFFPAGVWHYLEYTTTGMSIATRFGRNKYTKFLGDRCHLDSRLQRIAVRMIEEKIAVNQYSAEYSKIKQAYDLPARSVAEKVEQMTTAYQQVLRSIVGKSDPIYQIPVSTKRIREAFTLDAYNRYRDLIDLIPQFSGWQQLASTVN
jgi:Cupin-like domain